MSSLFLVVAAVIIVYKLINKTELPQAGLGGATSTTQTGNLPQAGVGGQPTGEQTGAQKLEPGTTVTPAGQETPAATGETTARENKIQDLIEYTSANATLSGDGDTVQYYDQADNKFYKINTAGEPVALTDKQFYNVDNVTWSPDKNKAVLEYPDGNKIIYNFETNKQVSLPKHWESFDFSPTGQQIVFKSIGYDPADSWLGVVSDNGTSAKTIEKIGTNADYVISSWSPNNQTVAMYSEGINLDQKMVYFIGLNGENFKSMTVNGRGFIPLWSPAGSRLLYSVYSTNSDMKPMLWTAEAQGDTIGANLKAIELQTWASKCVFASETEAYCAVPASLPTGAGLSPESARDQGDSLYLVNLNSGQTTLIDNSNTYNMSDLILTANKKTLYFTDKITGKLLKLAL